MASADYAVGGWQLSGIYTYTAGAQLLVSSQITAPRRRGEDDRMPGRGLLGPGFKNLHLSIAKKFAIKERAKVGIRMDAFNALNGMNWATPH